MMLAGCELAAPLGVRFLDGFVIVDVRSSGSSSVRRFGILRALRRVCCMFCFYLDGGGGWTGR